MDFTLNEQEEAIRTMASKFAKVELKKTSYARSLFLKKSSQYCRNLCDGIHVEL